MPTCRCTRVFLIGFAGILGARLIGCAGPQPLARATRPQDEAAYAALVSSPGETPRQAFLRARAAELGISVEEATKRDAAISATENPFNARRDPVAVSKGAVIYSHECMGCHGEKADGHGAALPMALSSIDFHRTLLRMDITMHGGPLKSWFKKIQEGSVTHEKAADGTMVTLQMPGFSDRLSREQTWLAITYLVSLDTDLKSQPAEPAR